MQPCYFGDLFLPAVTYTILEFVDTDCLPNIEQCNKTLRSIVVNEHIYKRRLNKIFIKKKLNNYLLLKEEVEENNSPEENSKYYKKKLLSYTHR